MPEPIRPLSVTQDHLAFLHQIDARQAERRRLVPTSHLDVQAEHERKRDSGLINYEMINRSKYLITGEWARSRIKGVGRAEESM